MSGAGAESEARREDEAARAEAQRRFAGAFVLEAGAGTGKTTVLVARIVAWCLGPGWERAAAEGGADGRAMTPDEVAPRVLRRVAAITFTEAAAAEMATRVGEALVRIERGEPPIGVDPDALPARREGRARALLGALDQLSVRTIHAFCRRLLADHPLESGLHPHFEVDADERGVAQVAREVVEAHLAAAYGDDPSPPHHLLAAHEVGPREIEEALLALLRDAVPPEALREDPTSEQRLGELRDDVAAGLSEFVSLEAGRLAGLGSKARSASALAEEIAVWAAAWSAPGSLDAATLEALLAPVRECWPAERKRLGQWAGKDFGKRGADVLAEDVAELAARAGRLQALLDHALALDLEALAAAREVLQPLLEEASRTLRARGIETYTALLRDASNLLVQHPRVAARVRGELDQLLVDEFQDTDRLQCELLQALALEGPEAERPALFLVGDPKQSIYGWRSADLRAYHDFVLRVEQAGGVSRRLSVNFRSAPVILDEVDRVIEPVMREVPRLQPPYQPLVPSEHTRDAAGFGEGRMAPVEHWVSWQWDDDEDAPDPKTPALVANELEARALAAELVSLREDHGVEWSRVALLFRATGDFDVYLGALRRAGVPYVVERDRNYYKRREVIEATALVRCLLDRHDHLALVTFLRSAWVGVPDAALYALWRRDLPERMARLGDGDEHYEAFRGAVEACAGELPDVPGIERLEGWERSLLAAGRALAGLRAAFARGVPDRFVEMLRSALAVEVSESARYLGAWRQANLDRFFRELIRALEETGGDVSAVLASLRQAVSVAREEEEGRPKDASESAVQVMTIHRAKGLDFDHVYLMQLHRGSRGNGTEGTEAAHDERERGVPRWEYRLLRWPTPGHHRVARDRLAVDEMERVRTLYVGMTRARQRLVLCASRPPGARSRSHAQLFEQRSVPAPDLVEGMARLRLEKRSELDEAGCRWVFPDLRKDEPARQATAAAAVELPSLARVEADSERLRALAEDAEHRARRPFRGVASGDPHEPDPEEQVALGYGEEGEGVPPPRPRRSDRSREVAREIGTAVHAALEQYDAAAELAGERARLEGIAEASLCATLAADELTAAREQTRRLLHGFLDGPLGERFRERVASHVVARELPVVLGPEPDGDGPVGFVAGAIDLVYRDPDSGEWVVADWKTDEVEGEAVAAKARAYARQGRLYTRALQEALGLAEPPRFELWFLAAGQVEVLEAP